MWNGKNKAITFSFDDGVIQDKRLVKLFDKYNLKGTFNLNSELLGRCNLVGCGRIHRNEIPNPKIKEVLAKYDKSFDFNIAEALQEVEGSNNPEQALKYIKIFPEEVKDLYKNHEVAVHTLTHPNLTELSKEEVIYQVEQDRLNLCKLVGYNVDMMAYPCGGTNNNDEVAQIIKENTGVKFSRTITSTYNFDLQDNLLRFNPSVYIYQTDKMFELAEEFVNLKTDTPKLFYIWGHSYEFDDKTRCTWETFEKFLQIIANKNDIYYGTNSEVFKKWIK